jgi:RNA-directed DNA polymerase
MPAGEIRARGVWVEAEVWTERMLTALEQGVLGGKWFSLMDKVYALPNLRRAFARVKANRGAAGVDHVTVKEFERHLEAKLEKLSRTLKDGSYRPQAIRRVWIPKPGGKEKRPLGIPTVRDPSADGCKRRFGQCWRRFSSGTSRRTATGSVRIGAARTRCAGSIPC